MEGKNNIDFTLQKTYKIIEQYINNKGYPPTVRELMNELNVNSTSTVKYYLDKLVEKKLIKRSLNKNRSIELTNKNIRKNNTRTIPLLGTVAAGTPIFAQENYDEFYEISNNLFKTNEDTFMLTVKGNSMINIGIYENDKIIVRKQSFAENTEIVVAMIDGEVTVKRFFKLKDKIKLQPENNDMQPIYSKNVQILGKVIGLIREY